MSHGRGGAGNIRPDNPQPTTEADLKIPKITSSVYTTGRGGQGNMAHNLDPEEARRAQDVEVDKEEVDTLQRRSFQIDQHAGRGGAGNIIHHEQLQQQAAELAKAAEGGEQVKEKKEANGVANAATKKDKRRSWLQKVKEKFKS